MSYLFSRHSCHYRIIFRILCYNGIGTHEVAAPELYSGGYSHSGGKPAARTDFYRFITVRISSEPEPTCLRIKFMIAGG